jgi:peptidoglycan/LPS O-acetylase OafA/YrhL
MSHSHYRPDVDGLRGVAVLLVLCFHAELGFPGGFLGVDVFFVISGYLITNLTLRELAEHRFSLGQFWLRRIRRILPACLVMLAGSLAIGAVLLLPADLVELSQSATAHLLMVANAFFWRKTGYFDGSVALKPLLHMWSLAVEEQFYLLFPLCLKWLPPVNRKRKVALVCIFAGSLLVGLYGHIRHPSAAFYLLPCRAWELLLGGVICLIPAASRTDKPWHSFAGPIGLLGILLCAAVPQPLWGRWLPPGLPVYCCTSADDWCRNRFRIGNAAAETACGSG